jgi:hypothetical protein
MGQPADCGTGGAEGTDFMSRLTALRPNLVVSSSGQAVR